VSNVTGPDTAPNHDQRFERLVDQYQESVLRTCYLYLCDKTLAEDATQETFLRVYRTMDSFRGESSEKTWILKIAMHTCYDINHSGWFRFMNRHVTPEMLPDQSANSVTRATLIQRNMDNARKSKGFSTLVISFLLV